MIFNRRLAACEFCNAPIPQELLYTEDERRRIDREVKDEIHRQMVALQKEQKKERDKEKKDANASDARIEQLIALATGQRLDKGEGKNES